MEHDITAGLGLQVIDVDITGSDADLLSAAKVLKAVVLHYESNEVEGRHEVAYSALQTGKPTETETSVYTAQVITAGATVTHTFFRIEHEFKRRGSYLIRIAIEDTNNYSTTASESIKVGIGDGFPDGVTI